MKQERKRGRRWGMVWTFRRPLVLSSCGQKVPTGSSNYRATGGRQAGRSRGGWAGRLRGTCPPPLHSGVLEGRTETPQPDQVMLPSGTLRWHLEESKHRLLNYRDKHSRPSAQGFPSVAQWLSSFGTARLPFLLPRSCAKMSLFEHPTAL